MNGSLVLEKQKNKNKELSHELCITFVHKVLHRVSGEECITGNVFM